MTLLVTIRPKRFGPPVQSSVFRTCERTKSCAVMKWSCHKPVIVFNSPAVSTLNHLMTYFHSTGVDVHQGFGHSTRSMIIKGLHDLYLRIKTQSFSQVETVCVSTAFMMLFLFYGSQANCSQILQVSPVSLGAYLRKLLSNRGREVCLTEGNLNLERGKNRGNGSCRQRRPGINRSLRPQGSLTSSPITRLDSFVQSLIVGGAGRMFLQILVNVMEIWFIFPSHQSNAGETNEKALKRQTELISDCVFMSVRYLWVRLSSFEFLQEKQEDSNELCDSASRYRGCWLQGWWH